MFDWDGDGILIVIVVDLFGYFFFFFSLFCAGIFMDNTVGIRILGKLGFFSIHGSN